MNLSVDCTVNLLTIPEVALETVFSFLTYDEIAKNRIVCRKFSQIGGGLLTRGFIQLSRRRAALHKKVKMALPRRESERRSHPLFRHVDILMGIETRISMLNMTYTKYVQAKLICFIPGKVLDELRHVLTLLEGQEGAVPHVHQMLQELRDLSSMAMEHFDEFILPRFKQHTTDRLYLSSQLMKNCPPLLPPPPPSLPTAAADSSSNVHASEMKSIQSHYRSCQENYRKCQTNNTRMVRQFRKHTKQIQVQTQKLNEQQRFIQTQSSRIQQQELNINGMRKRLEVYDTKYKDLEVELCKIRSQLNSVKIGASAAADVEQHHQRHQPSTYIKSEDGCLTDSPNLIRCKIEIRPRRSILNVGGRHIDFVHCRHHHLHHHQCAVAVQVAGNSRMKRKPTNLLLPDNASPMKKSKPDEPSLIVGDISKKSSVECPTNSSQRNLKVTSTNKRTKSPSVIGALNRNYTVRKRKMVDDIDLLN